MRVLLEPGFILHSRPYRESSVLLEALSREHGRIGLVAKGARGARSRWKSLLQPFRPLLLSWTQRGELGTLTGADQVAAPPALTGEPLFCALVCERVAGPVSAALGPPCRPVRSIPADARCTDRRSGTAARLAPVRIPGVDGGWFRSAAGARERHGTARFAPTPGTFISRNPGRFCASRKRSRAEELVSGAALLALKSGEIGDQYLRELKFLMRKLIRYYLGDRAIKSQQLFS